MDAYQDYVERRRVAERTLAAERAAGLATPREPGRKVNGWAVYWAAALAVWLAVTVAFVVADTSTTDSYGNADGDVLAPVLVGWTGLWAFGAVMLMFVGLALTDPSPPMPNQNQLLATQNGLIREQNRLLSERRAEARPAPSPRYRPLPREGYGLHGYLSTLKRRA